MIRPPFLSSYSSVAQRGFFVLRSSGVLFASNPHESDNNTHAEDVFVSSQNHHSRESLLAAIEALDAESQCALREIYQLATERGKGHLGGHAYYARILAGKYPAIRPFVLDESLSTQLVTRAPLEEAKAAKAARRLFQAVMAELALRTEASPLEESNINPTYVPVKQIPETEAMEYFTRYGEYEEPFIQALLKKYPSVIRQSLPE